MTWFTLAIFFFPPVLSRFVPLLWHIGNLTRAARAISALLALGGMFTVLKRRSIDSAYRRVFPTGRHFVASMALVGASVLTTAGLLELVLWKLNLPFDETWVASETTLAQFDPDIGWTYIPNHSAVQRFGTAQREVPMTFDAIGARVGSAQTRHSATAPTLILVGCSVTMGHGLPWDETIAGRLEADPAFPFQVVNLGVQAYGTDQAFLLLRRHIKDFNTKVVVYIFMDDHIVRNDNDDRRLIYPDARFIGTKPRFGLVDGRLVLREAPHRYADVWSPPRLWSYARLAWNCWGPLPDPAVTRELVREMRRLVERSGAIFFVLRWPGSGFAFHDPKLKIIDLGTTPPGWQEWTIPGDGHPDARADTFVSRILAHHLMHLGDASVAIPAAP